MVPLQVDLRSREGAAALTIGEVASRTGLRPSAIRYYEAQGLLPAAARRGGKRVYDRAIVDRLGMIALAKVAGFEIREIRGMLAGVDAGRPAATWMRLGARKRVALDAEIGRLTVMKEALVKLESCRCDTFEECGRAYNGHRGMER